MAESLNVIALISGGKDSFFSLLHCRQNGHKVVALGNLYPPPIERKEVAQNGSSLGEHSERRDDEEEEDLNSFMYQTVGHTVIPLYEEALGIPLYRQEIVGTAVETGTSYAHSESVTESSKGVEDETESLVPLLRRILKEHPEANAISTGAILSTYQRTRVESVALRLGLTPLSYLWKYPILPPGTQNSLLQDMQDMGLDAKIVKVASGGLDESYLWENVSCPNVMRRLEKSMKRFGTDGDGAVLGEGGEFETLVVDGPLSLFKGRIVVREEDKAVIREGGGSAWLKLRAATIIMKDLDEVTREKCRVPDLLDMRFTSILDNLNEEGTNSRLAEARNTKIPEVIPSRKVGSRNILQWTFTANGNSSDITEEADQIIMSIRQRLNEAALEPRHIISTVIVLRSMTDFVAFNKIYGALFTLPNPPARVTISSGTSMPAKTNLLIHLKIHAPPPALPARKALHVQSRSYWAPANIGPYSQAISIPLSTLDEDDNDRTWAVSIAGQIPLIPQSMSLPDSQSRFGPRNHSATAVSDFNLQATLSLQHLYRIGIEMSVCWFSSAIAYIPISSSIPQSARARLVGKAWAEFHRRSLSGEEDADAEDEEVRDLWEEKYRAGTEVRGAEVVHKSLPDWSAVDDDGLGITSPPCFIAEVEELPRGSGVEWHATLGVVSSNIKLLKNSSNEGWAVHQCVFGEDTQTVVAIDYSEEALDLGKKINSAVQAVVIDEGCDCMEVTSYIDVSIDGIWDLRDWKGVIPCKSLWDGNGGRLACVLLFGTC